MQKHNNAYKNRLSLQQGDELLSIYRDYMYAVRRYEDLLLNSSLMTLAAFYMESLYTETKTDFPWRVEFTTVEEKRNYQDFTDEKIHTAGNRAYVSLQHTDMRENHSAPITYVPQDFLLHILDVPLPASVERYTIAYPEKGLVGNTEFLIDGRFKAVYTRKENAGQPITEGLNSANMLAELRILVNMVESLCKDTMMSEAKFQRIALNSYASGAVGSFENTILEIMGSFADKMQRICRDVYKENDLDKALQSAEDDGLIPSAKTLRDYVNIRNLMRHSQDTMEELGSFNRKESQKNLKARARYLQSYLAVCGKTIKERSKSYVDVLHYMQDIISKIKPEALIRNKSESNKKFIARIKEYYRQNPEKPIEVEINLPMSDDKFKSIDRNLHKILPQIKVIDDFKLPRDDFSEIERDYQIRTWFLQTYNSFACRVMTYCMTRGQNLRRQKTWGYLKELKLMTKEESLAWQEYTDLRNKLSHNGLNDELRQKLREAEESYLKQLNELETRLGKAYPDIKWLRKGVYEYKHNDGLIVTIDFNKRDVSYRNELSPTSQFKIQGKIDLTAKDMKTYIRNQQKAHPQKEKYANGVELHTDNNRLTSIKLPSGVTINFEKQRIVWDKTVLLHTNADNFNVLQTANNKIITDKNFHVSEYWEKNRCRPLGAGDVCLLEYRHRAVVDSIGRLKEFNYKNDRGAMIKTGFRSTKNGAEIFFADGTKISLQGKSMILTHNGKQLSYAHRQEFAASYQASNNTLPPNINSGNGR